PRMPPRTTASDVRRSTAESSCSRRLVYRVPDATHGMDKARPWRRIDLRAEQMNERVERVALDIAVVPPHGLDQRAARHSLARATHQEMQQAELGAAQSDLRGAA